MGAKTKSIAKRIISEKEAFWSLLLFICEADSGPISCSNCRRDGYPNGITYEQKEHSSLYARCFPTECTCPDGSTVTDIEIESHIRECFDISGLADLDKNCNS